MNTLGPENPQISIACYKPKEGKEQALQTEVLGHHQVLASQGLVTDRKPISMIAKDGTVIEVFEWKSGKAIEEAHSNPEVLKMWERFNACCDYIPVGQVPEANDLFSGFAPVG